MIVRNLEDDLQQKLLELAQSHGQSLEEFVSEVLRKVAIARQTPVPKLGSRIAKRFSKIGLDSLLEHFLVKQSNRQVLINDRRGYQCYLGAHEGTGSLGVPPNYRL